MCDYLQYHGAATNISDVAIGGAIRQSGRKRHRRKEPRKVRRVSEWRPYSHIINSSSGESDVAPQPSVKPKRKRKYVGGYRHDGDDEDANFIQPEHGEQSLPDDVADGVGFKLGATKNDLEKQRRQTYRLLKSSIRRGEERKQLLDQTYRKFHSLEPSELHELYDKVHLLKYFCLIEVAVETHSVCAKVVVLERFAVEKLINGGEDVMNLIIDALERKGQYLVRAQFAASCSYVNRLSLVNRERNLGRRVCVRV